MNIFGHLVLDTQITGISPLRTITLPKGTQLNFSLYTGQYPVTIESRVYDVKNNNSETRTDELAALVSWTDEYNSLFSAIDAIINPTTITT